MSYGKDLLLEWAEALESGEYDQGEGSLLNSEGRYCCLGVLASVLGVSRRRMLNWSYLRNVIPGLLPEHAEKEFANANDGYESERLSFDDIADMIRQHAETME